MELAGVLEARNSMVIIPTAGSQSKTGFHDMAPSIIESQKGHSLMKKLDSPTVVQIGLIVKDIHKSARSYADVFGIAEPEIVPIAADDFAQTRFHGQPSSAQGWGAFFHLGPVEIELIEPKGKPSTWEEFLRTHGEGIHHLAFKTADMEDSKKFLASKGMETIQEGGWDGGQYAYVDATAQLSLILELLHFDK